MLLLQLKEYASQRMTLPPPLYSQAPVRYLIELAGDGTLLSRRPTDTADRSSRATERGQRLHVPLVKRTSGTKPFLLVDDAEYTFGLVPEKGKERRAQERHAAYVVLLERCATETGDSGVRAVLSFLRNDPLSALDLGTDFAGGDKMTFSVDGVLPIDSAPVQAFWATTNVPGGGDSLGTVMQCLVCGEERPVVSRLLELVKGLRTGQTAGTALISANAKAFESYGLEASLIAPTCAQCGEQFTKAINKLLSTRESHINLGSADFIFWTREEVVFDLAGPLTNPDAEQVWLLIESVRTGGRQPRLDDTAFYAAMLSGSGGRAVVRDWIDTTVGEVRQHLAQWFRGQAIVDRDGEASRPLGLYALAAATVRDVGKDLAPQTPRALLRAALNGTPLPPQLLYEAVRRIRAEQTVRHPRAALIKLVLCSKSGALESEEDTMVQLDPGRKSDAYQCGRLLAVLEQAQEAAIQGINQTIVDRFLGTASSAPGAVFPRLLQGARPHLAKLKRDRPATGAALQRRIEEIMGQLPGFPRTLTLEDQGLFALGYYHQRAHDRAERREAAERRRGAGRADGAPPAGAEDQSAANEGSVTDSNGAKGN